MSVSSTIQSARIFADRKWSSVRSSLMNGLTFLTARAPFVPDVIQFAPSDLRTGDPIQAMEFYRGRFALAGSVVELGGENPFLHTKAPETWLHTLHSFDWLVHFASGNEAVSAQHSRVLIELWIACYEDGLKGEAISTEVTAKRVISWLRHSPIILNGADADFYENFMRCIGFQIRELNRRAASAESGMPRLLAYLALCFSAICCANLGRQLSANHKKLAEELNMQVLSDGGHVSRNPQTIVQILEYLLPLKFTYIAAGMTPPEQLLSAIERIYPAIRFFRLSDGLIARFNGGGRTQSDLLSSLMRMDETRGQSVLYAESSGFQRLLSGESVAIMDVGNMPRGTVSKRVHAGCLSFEFSGETESIVTNCGTPQKVSRQDSAVWRSTAAHSTATIGNNSQTRFEGFGTNRIIPDGLILSPDLKAETSRKDSEHGTSVVGAHLGYAREFGVRHQRALTLDANGKRLRGTDWFTDPKKGDLRGIGDLPVHIRFHLHPLVSATVSDDHSVILTTRRNQQWKFVSQGAMPSIQESIFFASPAGPSQSLQIVLNVDPKRNSEIGWSFTRLD